ncbi:triphosphoribosyl-dephospho-CoA synthase [Chondromyces crocatus]|uniref:triphosphoribosyl-dephospho-CoA synthase n=1 Tax=Chondromyces crocatus TaxID=52 RepID=A0A0K1ESP2_CHOCO|nr:triphosphoribosyl-dephospho-CoA synthase [Chondromyces crocatus]AKT43886.1 triphosphoribosyl-dephospho-CoA synthase [Chondromyces crocatus]
MLDTCSSPSVGPAARLDAHHLGALATATLIAEAELTPKPALVDQRGRGAHTDLDLALMVRSACALQPSFVAMARAATGARPSQHLRERLALLGREAETTMLTVTAGANAHRGAIWALGLLVAAAAITGPGAPTHLAGTAGAIARFPDRAAPPSPSPSHGSAARARYGVTGARGEACAGFPHVLEHGLPALRAARARGLDSTHARLDALLTLMAHLDDTCLLHRGGLLALHAAQRGARAVLDAGGTSTDAGLAALHQLDTHLLSLNASPGGAADVLAATLFLDALDPHAHDELPLDPPADARRPAPQESHHGTARL